MFATKQPISPQPFKFRISHSKYKKYDALLDDGRIVSFGAIKRNNTPYQQYKDRTGLKAYSAYDHNDKERRIRYYKRHGDPKSFEPYTPAWFSAKYLW